MVGRDFVTAREATDILSVTGLPRTSLRRALNCGVAGEPIRTRAALLYRRASVESLLREPLTEATLPGLLAKGTFVARLRFGASVPVRFPEEIETIERLESVSGGWQMSWQTRLVLSVRAQRGAPMPLLATAGGFVVAGANITDARPMAGSRVATALTLEPAGDWYDELRLRILRTPPGRPWIIVPRDQLLHPWLGSTRVA